MSSREASSVDLDQLKSTLQTFVDKASSQAKFCDVTATLISNIDAMKRRVSGEEWALRDFALRIDALKTRLFDHIEGDVTSEQERQINQLNELLASLVREMPTGSSDDKKVQLFFNPPRPGFAPENMSWHTKRIDIVFRFVWPEPQDQTVRRELPDGSQLERYNYVNNSQPGIHISAMDIHISRPTQFN